jgi:hypothetical protein
MLSTRPSADAFRLRALLAPYGARHDHGQELAAWKSLTSTEPTKDLAQELAQEPVETGGASQN